ncbi:MAG: DUF1232 domain-containing protein [Planctomycetaceae bacterium]|nr:DUF1232 domain-containing protein [Planctomycetaceae bacterium]
MTTHGVSGFDDSKFWIALFCYGASLPLFMRGGLTPDNFHVVMPFGIAFIVTTTLAWDYRIIGDPRRPSCLILHCAMMVAMMFLLNRLTTLADFAPLGGNPAMVHSIIIEWMGEMPYLGNVFSIFNFVLKWLGFAVILFLVSAAIMFPPRTATALLSIFGLLVVAISVGNNMTPEMWSLVAGVALMAVAFAVQRVDERRSRFWNQVAEKLSRSGPRPAMDVTIKIALLRELNEQKALGANQIRGIIASKLDRATSDPQLNAVCARITDQLINHDHIAESRDGLQGWRCVLALPEDEPDFFTTTARTVRVLVTTVFCVIYILSLIDFIPDATPVFGVVDDMLLGAVGLLSVVRTVWSPSRWSDRTQRKLPF